VHGCSKPAAVPLDMLPLAERINGGPIDPRWTAPNTSPECNHCYAETLSNRRGWTPAPWLEANEAANVQFHPERFAQIAKLAVKPVGLPPSQRNRIFICSMGDLFHRLVPAHLLRRLFAEMANTPHIYQLLTKRPERAMEWPGPWPENVWLGTSCGHEITRWRVECLRRSKAKVRFVSAEPLLTSLLPIDLAGIDQVIVGGESGPHYRGMQMKWARELRDACKDQGCAFFLKQDAAGVTERRCYLVEEDGRCRQYRQFPGELTPPIEVQPDSAAYHREHFPILA
jgi:protein gp37